MKKITLLIGAIFVTSVSFSQVITRLVSVPCNTGLEGTYPFEYAGELDGSSTDWGLPNIFLGENSVQGPLCMIDDGTPGIVTGVGTPPLNNVPKSALGCDTTNYASQDMTGKIAVVYRGSCEFGLKAYNAQLRGAIGCIIINHTGDAVGMAGGTYGTQDTIPVVQVGRTAGDDLYLALQNCVPTCNSVIGFIGSKVNLYNNDMASSISDIVMPHQLANPSSINATDTIDLGLWAYNLGSNAQNGITASVSIVHEIAGQVYTNTSNPLNFLAPDVNTLLIDTKYFDLGYYIPAAGQGAYTITYTLGPNNDDDTPDNSFTVVYRSTESIYSKARIGVGNLPIPSTAYSLNETTTAYDDYESCIVFRNSAIASGPNGQGSAVGMTFSAAPVGNTMTNEMVEVRMYQWNDVFVDLNTTPTFTLLPQLTQGLYFFAGTPDSLDNQYVAFDAPTAMADNQRYLFCVYNASDSLRIGFDTRIDYFATANNYLQPVSPVKTLPNGGAAEWYSAGFGWDATTAVTVTIDFPTAVNNIVEKEVSATPYPNPAVNILNVPVRKGVKGAVNVEIIDLTGKVVLSDNKTIGEGPLKINVASIANGAYMFRLTFADGSKDAFKVSVNR